MQPLKMFGLGILWALLFPFILVGVVIVGAFGLVNFLIEFVVMIVNFFRGKKLFPLYKEDQQAYDVLKRALDKKNAASSTEPAPAPAPQQLFVQQNFYTSAPLPPGMQGQPLPPGMQGQPLPPGYIPPQMTQAPYSALPNQPQQNPTGYIPEQQAAPSPAPQRPELAKLPSFDASEFSSKTETIEIDIDEAGGDNDD